MQKIKTDFLIVGSGFYGCVLAERISSVLKKKVTIIEKRNHIGGNCYSEIDKPTGIEYHKYGTHIFHTSIKRVIDYLNDFAKFKSSRLSISTEFFLFIIEYPIGFINLFL